MTSINTLSLGEGIYLGFVHEIEKQKVSLDYRHFIDSLVVNVPLDSYRRMHKIYPTSKLSLDVSQL